MAPRARIINLKTVTTPMMIIGRLTYTLGQPPIEKKKGEKRNENHEWKADSR
jgi:hypothetical protein